MFCKHYSFFNAHNLSSEAKEFDLISSFVVVFGNRLYCRRGRPRVGFNFYILKLVYVGNVLNKQLLVDLLSKPPFYVTLVKCSMFFFTFIFNHN